MHHATFSSVNKQKMNCCGNNETQLTIISLVEPHYKHNIPKEQMNYGSYNEINGIWSTKRDNQSTKHMQQ